MSTTILIPPKAERMENILAKEGLVSPDANKVGDIGSNLFSDLICGLQLVIYITMTAFSIFSGVTGSLLCLLPADLLAIMAWISCSSRRYHLAREASLSAVILILTGLMITLLSILPHAIVIIITLSGNKAHQTEGEINFTFDATEDQDGKNVDITW